MRSRLSIVELRRNRPTRSAQEMRALLDGVFDDVFADPAFRTVLVQQIVTIEIDPQLGDGAAPVIHVGEVPRDSDDA